MRRRARLAAVPVALALALLGTSLAQGAATATESGPVDAERVLRWQDTRIQESSGLVDRGRTMITTNDSGDQARLYVVDRAGRTLRTVDYGVEVRDVEALAPAGPGHVWVGDIGDNLRQRADIAIHRVRVSPGPGPRTRSYRLVYPEQRSYDAESLTWGPGGRLHVITKGLTGGVVFEAPERLREDRVNRLREVARVGELATDAAVSRDGRLALVRGLAGMGVYALPSWERLTTVALPAQRQGEGLSLGPGDRVRLSSEGPRTWVWQLRLPASVAAPTSSAPDRPADGSSGPVPAPGAGPPPGIALVAGVIGVGALGIGLALRRRERPLG
jgi:hypothetical protein